MSDDLVDFLERQKANEKPCGGGGGHIPYPCAKGCPCDLRDRVISDAARIEELQAENARLREAGNQMRLALAGYVSVKSGIDAWDSTLAKGDK